jgi:hypothetical protein
MKTKDQIFLENAYSKIAENDSSNFEEEKMNALELAERELSSSPIGKNIHQFLTKIRENYSSKDLIDFLNEKENWVAKDNLIQFLFRYY